MKVTKYKGRYLEITEEDMEGYIYERFRMRDGLRVYPVKDRKILMINEFRRHEGGSRWKFIGGWLDKENKDALTTAQEELLEEVGMESDEWEQFHIFDTGDATVGIRSIFFIAQNPRNVPNPPKNPDFDVVNEVKWVGLEELWNMIDAKEVLWDYDIFGGVQVLRSLQN